MKTGTDAIGTAKNMSGSAKHANGTRRPRLKEQWSNFGDFCGDNCLGTVISPQINKAFVGSKSD
jgi:hypothetical protein